METDLIDFEDENPDETVLDGDSDEDSDDGSRQTIDQENPAGGHKDHPPDKGWVDFLGSKKTAASKENSVSTADLEKMLKKGKICLLLPLLQGEQLKLNALRGGG
jgi:hypothetical protein